MLKRICYMKEGNPLPNDVSWDSSKAILFAEAIWIQVENPTTRNGMDDIL